MLQIWLPIIISAISLLISFMVAFNSWWRARAVIKIEQPDNGSRSTFLKSFDGCNKVYEYELSEKGKSLPNFHSIILIEVIITNASSLPLSVLEFSIPNYPKFNSYTHTQDSFTVTYTNNSTISYGTDSPIPYLQPEFTLEPYTSVRGFIYFWSGQERDFDTNTHTSLTIRTSRKDFNKKILIDAKYESIKKNVRYSINDYGEIAEEYY